MIFFSSIVVPRDYFLWYINGSTPKLRLWTQFVWNYDKQFRAVFTNQSAYCAHSYLAYLSILLLAFSCNFLKTFS